MIRFGLALGAVLLLADGAFAQTYCTQVREAVATYGYETAKAYGLANYGKEAVEAAEKCLAPRHRLGGAHSADAQARPRRG
jgi:hypothetical protein